MSGYNYINQVTDPNSQKALKVAMDLIGALRSELDTLKAGALTKAGAVNVGGQRITNLASPQADSDAATAAYVRSYSAAQIESFKGQAGIDGIFTTAGVFTVTVEDGLIVSIT